ncbi:conserved hypothetical protein [Hyphomicrobiales bacterium]|nr:conserved hypothetical protein [Hyphomicrobiales bacterium]CAH1689667.1 conserved hypothetical protein [Hyphomicrobiales bacterium]
MEKDAELRAKSQSEDLKGGDPIPPMRADDHSSGDPAVQTPVEARQGFLDRPVLTVLIAGLTLAMLAWVAVEVIAS